MKAVLTSMQISAERNVLDVNVLNSAALNTKQEKHSFNFTLKTPFTAAADDILIFMSPVSKKLVAEVREADCFWVVLPSIHQAKDLFKCLILYDKMKIKNRMSSATNFA